MTEVTVIGAGPVGLSAALAVRSRGQDVTILEAGAEDRPRPGSRAIFVHRATLELFERIHPGLGGRIQDRGMVWRTKRTLWHGREVYARTYRGPATTPPFTSLPQTTVEALLREACAEAGVKIAWGDPLERVRTGASGVRLTTAAGVEHLARYVIAADGARSVAREQAGLRLRGSSSTTGFVVVDVADGPEPLPPERVFHYRHPGVGGRNVLLVPFRGGRRVDVQCRPGDVPEQWAATPDRWLPGVLPEAYAHRVTWSSAYRFHQRLADRFADAHDRLLLAGEAAHLLPPFGARGMNSGVADAVAAAEAVAIDSRAAVRSYAHARRTAAEQNVRAAGHALAHLLAEDPGRRAAQRVAAAVAPVWERAGRWLDMAPYGPPLRSLRY